MVRCKEDSNENSSAIDDIEQGVEASNVWAIQPRKLITLLCEVNP